MILSIQIRSATRDLDTRPTSSRSRVTGKSSRTFILLELKSRKVRTQGDPSPNSILRFRWIHIVLRCDLRSSNDLYVFGSVNGCTTRCATCLKKAFRIRSRGSDGAVARTRQGPLNILWNVRLKRKKRKLVRKVAYSPRAALHTRIAKPDRVGSAWNYQSNVLYVATNTRFAVICMEISSSRFRCSSDQALARPRQHRIFREGSRPQDCASEK